MHVLLIFWLSNVHYANLQLVDGENQIVHFGKFDPDPLDTPAEQRLYDKIVEENNLARVSSINTV